MSEISRISTSKKKAKIARQSRLAVARGFLQQISQSEQALLSTISSQTTAAKDALVALEACANENSFTNQYGQCLVTLQDTLTLLDRLNQLIAAELNDEDDGSSEYDDSEVFEETSIECKNTAGATAEFGELSGAPAQTCQTSVVPGTSASNKRAGCSLQSDISTLVASTPLSNAIVQEHVIVHGHIGADKNIATEPNSAAPEVHQDIEEIERCSSKLTDLSTVTAAVTDKEQAVQPSVQPITSTQIIPRPISTTEQITSDIQVETTPNLNQQDDTTPVSGETTTETSSESSDVEKFCKTIQQLYQMQTITEDKVYSVRHSFHQGPNYLWLQYSEHDVNEIGDYIRDGAEHNKFTSLQLNPIVGDLLLAIFEEDQEYYRAVVKQVYDKQSHVFFIDYGNFEKVENSKLLNLDDKLKSYPPQAILVSLEEVFATANKGCYTSKALSRFEELLYLDLTAKVRKYSSCSVLLACLFANQKNISNELIFDGLADRITVKDLFSKYNDGTPADQKLFHQSLIPQIISDGPVKTSKTPASPPEAAKNVTKASSEQTVDATLNKSVSPSSSTSSQSAKSSKKLRMVTNIAPPRKPNIAAQPNYRPDARKTVKTRSGSEKSETLNEKPPEPDKPKQECQVNEEQMDVTSKSGGDSRSMRSEPPSDQSSIYKNWRNDEKTGNKLEKLAADTAETTSNIGHSVKRLVDDETLDILRKASHRLGIIQKEHVTPPREPIVVVVPEPAVEVEVETTEVPAVDSEATLVSCVNIPVSEVDDQEKEVNTRDVADKHVVQEEPVNEQSVPDEPLTRVETGVSLLVQIDNVSIEDNKSLSDQAISNNVSPLSSTDGDKSEPLGNESSNKIETPISLLQIDTSQRVVVPYQELEIADTTVPFKVIISYLVSPTEFYVNIATLKQRDLASDFDDLQNQIQDYYSRIANTMLRDMLLTDFSPKVGDYCITKYSKDESYYRAEIVDIRPPQQVSVGGVKLEQTNFKTVQVFFIDYGNTDWVSLDSIYPLMSHYAELPPMAWQCRLADVYAPQSSELAVSRGGWTQSSINEFKNLLHEDDVCYMYVINARAKMVRETLHVIIGVENQDPESEKTTTTWVNEKLVSDGFASSAFLDCSKEEEINPNITLEVRSNQSTASFRQDESEQAGSVTDQLVPEISTEVAELNDLEQFNPMSTDYHSPYNMYGCNLDDAETLINTYKSKSDERICRRFSKTGHCFKGELCPYDHVRERDGAATEDQKEVVCGDVPLKLPKLLSWIAIEITAILSPSHFYCHLPFGPRDVAHMLGEAGSVDSADTESQNEEISVEQLTEQLNEHYSKTSNRMKKDAVGFAVGELVAAKYSIDEMYYRGRVIESDPDLLKVKVFFVDFGNTETVTQSNVFELLPRFLHVPFQAVECFTHLYPRPRKSWNKKSIDIFTELVEEKLIIAHVLDSNVTNSTLTLDIVDSSGETDIWIKDVMCEKNLAVYKTPDTQAKSNQSNEKGTIYQPG